MPEKPELIYLIHGDAPLLISETLNKLLKEHQPETNPDFNFDIFDGEITEIEGILAAVNMLPVFANSRLVLVKNATKYFENPKKEGNVEEAGVVEKGEADYTGKEKLGQDTAIDSLITYAKNPNPTTTLILIASKKIDTRLKKNKEFIKLISVQACNELQFREVVPWLIQRARNLYQKKLTIDAAQYLQTALGRDSAMLSGELEKLALYCTAEENIELKYVKILTPSDSKLIIFDFIDALIAKKPERSLEILHTLLNWGEPPVKILVILAGQLRRILSAKALKVRGLKIHEITSLLESNSDYMTEKYLSQGNHFTVNALQEALSILADADAKTKMGMGDGENLLINGVLTIAGLVK